jgi:hypothetical protein
MRVAGLAAGGRIVQNASATRQIVRFPEERVLIVLNCGERSACCKSRYPRIVPFRDFPRKQFPEETRFAEPNRKWFHHFHALALYCELLCP